jgi:putative nucleotidyltransferase with HDIG domain
VELLSVQDLHVPILPDSIARVIEATSGDDPDSRRLAALVERDASLAAHVLRLAGSAVFSAQRVSSLLQAVSRLGVAGLRQVALLVAAEANLFKVPGREKDVRQVLAHSCLAATISRELCRLRRKNGEEAFLAALLHDVGKPILWAALAVPERRERLGVTDAELDTVVHRHHGHAASQVAGAWRLSPPIVDAVANHHDPFDELGHVVALADAIAHWADEGPRDKDASARLLAHPSILALDLYPEDLEALLARRDEIYAAARSVMP